MAIRVLIIEDGEQAQVWSGLSCPLLLKLIVLGSLGTRQGKQHQEQNQRSGVSRSTFFQNRFNCSSKAWTGHFVA